MPLIAPPTKTLLCRLGGLWVLLVGTALNWVGCQRFIPFPPTGPGVTPTPTPFPTQTPTPTPTVTPVPFFPPPYCYMPPLPPTMIPTKTPGTIAEDRTRRLRLAIDLRRTGAVSDATYHRLVRLIGLCRA
jgi:hypothetical protein